MSHAPDRTWPHRLHDFLASGRLAVYLLAALAVLLLLYIWIPQWEPSERFRESLWLEEGGYAGWLALRLGLTDIRHSWWLYGACGLLAVNLVLCMFRRVRPMWSLLRFPERAPRPQPGWVRRESPSDGLDPECLASFLRRRGYRVGVDGDMVWAVRGRYAVVGHWIFHVSLLALLGGGVYVAAGPEGFRGVAGVGEGEPFDIHGSVYLSTNEAPRENLPALAFTVREVDVLTDAAGARRFDVRLDGVGEGERVVGINRPLRLRPLQILANGFGYMPGWVIVNSRGKMLRGAWLKLVPYPLIEEEFFSIGPESRVVHVSFYPDHKAAGEGDSTESFELLNPRFRTRIVSGGETIFEGLLSPGERVPLERGRAFYFLPEIRKYAVLYVLEERGHAYIFSTLGAMVGGLLLRYVRTRKEIVARVGPASTELAGRSEMLPSLFDEEMDGMVEDLARLRSQLACREAMA